MAIDQNSANPARSHPLVLEMWALVNSPPENLEVARTRLDQVEQSFSRIDSPAIMRTGLDPDDVTFLLTVAEDAARLAVITVKAHTPADFATKLEILAKWYLADRADLGEDHISGMIDRLRAEVSGLSTSSH